MVTVTDSTPTLVTSIVVSGTNELTVGGSTTLIANVLPNDVTDKTVRWNSFNKSVTTITCGGKATEVAPGTTNITGTAKDTSGVVSTTITANVRVTNHNSFQQPHTIEGSDETTTLTKKTLYGNGNTIIDGVTFNLESDTAYFNYAGRGQQISSIHWKSREYPRDFHMFS